MRRIILIAAALMLAVSAVHAQDEAQELNCTVEVNADKVQNVNKDVFNTMKQAISDYMNTTKWTDAQFGFNERIVCKLFFTISEYNDGTGQMKGDLQIQSQRPVYNSNYTTTVINFKDTKIDFVYMENDPLVFNEQEMQSNLTAILNFYAYLIIAMDFDTFALNGGEPYYEKAANVVRLAQSTSEIGWKAFEDSKNRSAVISAFTDKQTAGVHDILYNYHRMGLDQMVVSVDKGRATITKQLDILKQIYDVNSMSVCLSMFRDAKMDELVNIYSKAGTSEKESVYETLYPIYPTDLERLDKIKKVSEDNF
ncbi:MAG: DUF4835 family protein [Muribaculaceae bacterium]|nr:DUF4835 family protein [Muribaculaceae bacterium]